MQESGFFTAPFGHRSGHLCRSHCRNLLLFRREGTLVYDKTTRSVELPSYNVSFSREEGVQIEYVVASRVWGGERNVRNFALYLIACRDGKQERWSIVKPLFAGRSLDYLLIPLTRETDLPVVETKRYQDAWRNWQTQEPYPGTPSPDGS